MKPSGRNTALPNGTRFPTPAPSPNCVSVLAPDPSLTMFSPRPAVTYGACINPRVPLPRFNACSTLTPGANTIAPRFESQLTDARASNMFGVRDSQPTRASTGAANWTPDPALLPRLAYWNARSTPNSF